MTRIHVYLTLFFLTITSAKAQVFEGLIGSTVASRPFEDPYGLAVDASGNVFVGDPNSDKISKFDSNGTLLLYWTDNYAESITTDASGNVYVTGCDHRAKKYTGSGTLIKKWGSAGIGDGEFNCPYEIAIDAAGNIYVSDYSNRIQKFSNNGDFTLQWGTTGTGDGQFSHPSGIAIDSDGNILVTDSGNDRIQKFTSNGVFISKWGITGTGDGEFDAPIDISLDAMGNVYILEYYNDRVQKFSSNGSFITKWGGFGTGDGQFRSPREIAIDASGNVFVSDTQNQRIQKFTSNGVFIDKWSSGIGNGQFTSPRAVARDIDGNIYVADAGRNRIQKFSSNGTFISKWGSFGVADGQFNYLAGIATDAAGNVYVADELNHRIQKFTSSGVFITKWDNYYNPQGIAVDPDGSIYVSGYEVIKKYTSNGVFINQWGTSGTGDGQFNYAQGIAIDATGNLYVCDGQNHRVQKFTSSGTFISKWGTEGSGDGQFSLPVGIAIDQAGNIYVTELFNSRIQKFTSTGEFFSGWGSFGTGDTDFYSPRGIAFDGNDHILVANQDNNRVQKFSITPLKLDSFSPLSGIKGEEITLSGTGFSTVKENHTVTFNGITAEIVSSSATSITVKVPADATSGKIAIKAAGVSVESMTDFTLVPLRILDTNYDSFFTNSYAAISVTVNDPGAIVSGTLKSRGITQQESDIKTTSLDITNNIVSYTFSLDKFIDPMGMNYEFVFSDIEGNEVKSEKGYTYRKYSNGETNRIPDLIFGNTVDKYQLIAVPLELEKESVESVFSSLIPYNSANWRLYGVSQGKNNEYPTFTAIHAGNGYWFIGAKETPINPGAGNVVQVTEDKPFIKTLTTGWNLVGNPYNFKISWEDVLEYNGHPSGVSSMRQYIEGTFVERNILERYRAGFVYSDEPVVLKIPIINRNGSGDRIRESRNQSAIDEPHWVVNMIADDGTIRNELFGFGMHPQAAETKDKWDETSLPILSEINSFEMQFRKIDKLTLAKDIVETGENYSWDATIMADKILTLSWDNRAFGNSNKQLIIENKGNIEVINMRLNNQMTFPAGSHHLKIYFGDQAYIDQQINGERLEFGEMFPNPINQSGKLRFWANLPEKTNVRVTIFNGLGDVIRSTSLEDVESGRRILEWDFNFADLSPGLYQVQIEGSSNKLRNNLFKKLIIN